jgi:glucose-1-phosphate adenylyltransferase
VTQDHYWTTLDSLDTYYQANMDLLNTRPSIDIYQPDWQIRTYQAQTPPARTIPGEYGTEGIFINSICAGGTVIEGGSVQHSILFPNVYVGDDAFVEQSIVFEQVKIGTGARIKNCIIEKGNTIPRDEEIGHHLNHDRERFQVSDKGLVVVPSGFF